MTPTIGKFQDGSEPAQIDIKRLLETRMLIQANSGGGKSWAIRRLLEQTAGLVPQLVIDPEGEFSSLREKYDYVIAAAHDGDALAHPKTAQLLARRLLETGVSAILDIYDLKAHERQAFVRLFIEALMNAPKALWQPRLIVLDEAHVFAPEAGKAESAGAVIDLATRGRKRGFALIAATQRLAKLHKDAAAELLNKLVGRTGLDVDVKRAGDELGMTPREAMGKLRPLAAGEFFAFGPALSMTVRRLKVGDVKTTHPRAGDRTLRAPPKPTEAIKAVLPKLYDLPKEAEQEARSIEELKRELANVRRELTHAKHLQPSIAVADKNQTRLIERQRAAIEALMKFVININAQDFAAKTDVDPTVLQKAIEAAITQATKLIDAKLEERNRGILAAQREGRKLIDKLKGLFDTDIGVSVEIATQEPFKVKPSQAVPRINGADSGVGNSGKRRILVALAQQARPVDQRRLSLLTGLSARSGTWSTYLSSLRSSGYIDGSEELSITQAGIEALGAYEPLPTGDALIDYWRNRLGSSGKRAIFDAVIEAYPSGMEQERVANATGLSARSGTWSTYLSELRGLGLIEGKGELRASQDLFQ